MLTEIARLARDHFTLRFDYSDRRQEASQRRVEPYRIVNAGLRWYLVAWDLDREDWRTFRVDRMREGMSPGPRFTPRELSDADAEALVARGVPLEARQHQAGCRRRRRRRSCSSGGARCSARVTPIDDASCTIHAGADTVEQLAAWLGMLGVDFRVTEPPELVAAVQALSARYAAATRLSQVASLTPASRHARAARHHRAIDDDHCWTLVVDEVSDGDAPQPMRAPECQERAAATGLMYDEALQDRIATGRPRLVIVINSPPATASRSRGRWVFASSAPTCRMPAA